jgi:hypothetical protein
MKRFTVKQICKHLRKELNEEFALMNFDGS